MAAHTVRKRGTDPNGRGIFMSDYMADWWEQVCDELGFTPTIVQGAWMTLAGGGAGESAGYHDGGGCLDLRLWDRTSGQRTQMIRVFRRFGAAYWERYESQGFDLHAHLALGSDFDLDSGADWQWREYLAGRNGLASQGRDYHPRPNPIVTKPPQEDPMADYAAQLDRIESKVDRNRDVLVAFRKNVLPRLKKLEKETKDDASRAEVRQVIAALEALAPEDE